jgi:transaldolase
LKLFVETSDPAEARVWFERRVVDGVATSLPLGDPGLARLCGWAPGPVSAPAAGGDSRAMLREARALARLGPQVVVRLPSTLEGLATAQACRDEGIPTHLTACDSPVQAVLAAKAGARYVSPADAGAADRNDLLRGVVAVLRTYGLPSEVLAAPVRTPGHVVDVALAGADVAAVPAAVLEQVVKERPAGWSPGVPK